MSTEAHDHFQAWARDYQTSGREPKLTAGDLFVGRELAWKALPKYDHTYRGGYRLLAAEWGLSDGTVRYHARRLIAAGGLELLNDPNGRQPVHIGLPGLEVETPVVRKASRTKHGHGSNRDNRSDKPYLRKGLTRVRKAQSQRPHRSAQTANSAATTKSPKRLEEGGVHATPPAAPPAPDGASRLPLGKEAVDDPTLRGNGYAVREKNATLEKSEPAVVCQDCGIGAAWWTAATLAEHQRRVHSPMPVPQPATRVCSACGSTYPAEKFCPNDCLEF